MIAVKTKKKTSRSKTRVVSGKCPWEARLGQWGTFRLMQALIAFNLTKSRSEDEHFQNQSVDEGFNQHKYKGKFKTTL